MVAFPGVEPRTATSSLLDQDTWISIRLLHRRQGKTKSWIARHLGISRNTVRKYLEGDDPPAYSLKQPRGKPVADQWEEHVRDILAEDRNAPRKQHHTAKRVFERLVKERGYPGSVRTVQKIVAGIRSETTPETYLPLVYQPGKDAQVDFSESYVDIAGVRTKLYAFEMRSCYSRKKFVAFFPALNTEAFLEGHVRAFEHFGGVPERLTYDNLTLAVTRVEKGKRRQLTKNFLQLKGHYAFEENFCQPGLKGAHEKGGVESSIRFSRQNWLVPVPSFQSLEQLNEYVLAKCIEDENRTVHGQQEPIGTAFEKERPLLLPLPAVRMSSGVARHGCVADRQQTVVFDKVRYSVPAQYCGKPLAITSFWNRIDIAERGILVASHTRSYADGEYVLAPQHYFDLLERKPHAVAYARPLLGTDWPDQFWDYHREVCKQKGKSDGGKDFIRVLRLHHQFGAERVSEAIARAKELSVFHADFIASLLYGTAGGASEPPAPLSGRDELAQYAVKIADTAEYQVLLGGMKNDECVA